MKKTTDFDFSGLANMCEWEHQKALFLMQEANKLGYNYLSTYGEVDVNQNSGYVYLWSDNYLFSLYMPISCKLDTSDIGVNYTDTEGNEHQELLQEFIDSTNKPNSLNLTIISAINIWIESIEDEIVKNNKQLINLK